MQVVCIRAQCFLLITHLWISLLILDFLKLYLPADVNFSTQIFVFSGIIKKNQTVSTENTFYLPRMRVNVFVHIVCVCLGYNCCRSRHRKFILERWYILTISKFKYQGHWVKVKVTQWKMLILLLGYQFKLVLLVLTNG